MSDIDPYRASARRGIARIVYGKLLKHGAAKVTPMYPCEESASRELERAPGAIAAAKILAGRTYPLRICRLAPLRRGKLRVGEKRTLYSGALSRFKEGYAGH